MSKVILFGLLTAIGIGISTPALAGSYEKSFKTEEGYSLVVERKGRSLTSFSLSTGLKSEDITCTAFSDNGPGYLRPAQLSMKFSTAANRSKNTSQYGDVMAFDISDGLIQQWIMMPRMCAIGISAQENLVYVTVGNQFKMNGRSFSLSPETAEKLSNMILQNY